MTTLPSSPSRLKDSSVIDGIAALEHLAKELRSLIDPFIRFGPGKRITVLAGIAILAAIREAALTLENLKQLSKGDSADGKKLQAEIRRLEDQLGKLFYSIEPYIPRGRTKRMTANSGNILHMLLAECHRTIELMKEKTGEGSSHE